jgi:formylglycine-generating enzyme required for sulfatase activity
VKTGEFKYEEMIYKNEWGVKEEGNHWVAQKGYENHPVISVTWFGANEFCKFFGGQLPTEAQWEYAARGGVETTHALSLQYAGSDNIDSVAWHEGNSLSKGAGNLDYGTHQVGTKKPNQLGIYDMTGNVWEWCGDWYDPYSTETQINPTGSITGSYRVYRGGLWDYNTSSCRCAFRNFNYPSTR